MCVMPRLYFVGSLTNRILASRSSSARSHPLPSPSSRHAPCPKPSPLPVLQRSTSAAAPASLDDASIPPFTAYVPPPVGSVPAMPPQGTLPSSRHLRRASAAGKAMVSFPARRLSSTASAVSLLHPLSTSGDEVGDGAWSEEGRTPGTHHDRDLLAGSSAGPASAVWNGIPSALAASHWQPSTPQAPPAASTGTGPGPAGRLSLPPGHHRSATMGSLSGGGPGAGGGSMAGSSGGAGGAGGAPKRVFIPTNATGTRPRSVSSLVSQAGTPTGGGGSASPATSYLKEMAKRQAHAAAAASTPGASGASGAGSSRRGSGAPGPGPSARLGAAGGGGATSGSDADPPV